jgi:hypothetical protein
MSPAATLVMVVVVLVLAGAWLAAVFLAARQPASGRARQGREDAAPAAAPDAVLRSENAPSAPHAGTPAG